MTFPEVYPHKRILIGFTLCPSFVVFCFYFSLVVISLINVSDWSEFIKVAQEQFTSILVAGTLSVLAGQFFFLPPSLLLGFIFSACKFYKTPKALFFAFILGGAFAALWSVVFSQGDRSVDFSLGWGLFSPKLSFVLGAISSFFIGLVVLPKPQAKEPL